MTKNIYRLFAVLTMVFVAAALVKSAGFKLPNSAFPEGEVAEITEITAQDWTGLEEGAGVFYTIPEEASSALVLEIESNYASMEIYLDDVLLYSFSDEYQEYGRALHWIDIPEGSNGKRIIFTSVSDTALVEKTLKNGSFLGTADAIRHRFFIKKLPMLFLTVVDGIMAGIVAVILIALRHKLPLELVRGMWDLMVYIVLNGVWLLSDSGFMECFTTRTGLWALISYITFMLMPVFMVRFAQRLLHHNKKLLCILGMTSLGFTSATLVLYLTRTAPLSTLLPFHHLIIIVDFVEVFLLCNYEIRHCRIRRLVPVRNGIILMGILETSAILFYWLGMNNLYPLIYGAGFTCYIVCLTVSVVYQAYYNLRKKAKMDTYRKLAYKDAMTDIYNRSAFTEYQKGAGANVQGSAYIMFDINGLKHINDTMGHQAGDALIMQAAACIRGTFEGTGNCYRIGGDEFVVVLGNIHSKKEVDTFLKHFEKQVWLSNKRHTRGQPLLSIAFGYSLAIGAPRTGTEMYNEADESMYSMKKMMKMAV